MLLAATSSLAQEPVHCSDGRQNGIMLSRPDYAPLLHRTAPPSGVNPDAHAVQSLAAANGWEYFTHAAAQPLPGVIFREPNGKPRFMQSAVNIVRLAGPPSIEIGNTVYLETAVGNQFAQNWGYAAVHTGRALPALVVEADRNRRVSALPSAPRGAVETRWGEPDREVVLHADPSATAWARAVFTPELCALLDDGILAFDVELSDGWVFLYTPGRLATPDPDIWDRILGTITAIVERLDAATPAPSATPVAPAPPAAAISSAPRQTGPGPQTTPAAPVMRSRGWDVNGRRIVWYSGAVAAAVVLFGAAFALFGPR